MVTRLEMAEWLQRQPETEADSVISTPDKRTSISSVLIRAMRGGRLTIGVGSDVPSAQAATALVDLAAWRLLSGSPSGVTLILADGRPEVVDAALTLRSSMSDIDAVLTVLDDRGEERIVSDPPPDFGESPRASRWKKLLDRWRTAEPPALARQLADLVKDERLRLYPMLSGNPATGDSVHQG